MFAIAEMGMFSSLYVRWLLKILFGVEDDEMNGCEEEVDIDCLFIN